MTLTKLQFRITFDLAGLPSGRAITTAERSAVSNLTKALPDGQSVTFNNKGQKVNFARSGDDIVATGNGKQARFKGDIPEGSLADDFARGCTSSLFDLRQQLASLKGTQVASLSLTAEMLKPQNASFLKDDGSWLEAGRKNCLPNAKNIQKMQDLDLPYQKGEFPFEPKVTDGKIVEIRQNGRVVGYEDVMGNEWMKGPNHGAGIKEWDVQLSQKGKNYLDNTNFETHKIREAKKAGYVNIDDSGNLSH